MLAIDIQQHIGDFRLALRTEIPEHGITAIFGPSGSGKSSLLNAIAGFTDPGQHSAISFNDQPWYIGSQSLSVASGSEASARAINVPIHRRRIAYVTQAACLFEHLSVKANLDFAIQRRKAPDRLFEDGSTPEQNMHLDFDTLCESLDITSLLMRMPNQLSGGEQQRVAIARALLSNPQLMLLDEPLSALDEASRENVLHHLEKLHKSLALPFIYVTHSIDELLRLADQVVLLDQGQLVSNAALAPTLADLTLPLSRKRDAGVVIESQQFRYHEEHQLIELALGAQSALWINGSRPTLTPQQSIRVRVYARDVSIALSPAQDSSILNIIAAVVEQISKPENGQVIVRLNCDNHSILSRITARSLEQLQLQTGQQVFAQIKGIALLGTG